MGSFELWDSLKDWRERLGLEQNQANSETLLLSQSHLLNWEITTTTARSRIGKMEYTYGLS